MIPSPTAAQQPGLSVRCRIAIIVGFVGCINFGRGGVVICVSVGGQPSTNLKRRTLATNGVPPVVCLHNRKKTRVAFFAPT